MPVMAPEALLQHKAAYTLLLARDFHREILEEQATYRERGGRFIVPTPRPEIV